MTETREAPNALSRPLKILLSHLSQDWITLVFDLYRVLRRWVQQQSHEGTYQILDYDSTLELVDTKGKTASFKRRQRIKFLQDYIIAFQDYAWGDGNIFADYKCSPGIEVDRYREGNQWNILISLRETKSVGDILDFFTERKIKDGFTKDKEWWQVEIRHRTEQFKLDIIFPQQRHCKRATLLQKSRQRTAVLGPEHFTTLPDGRQVLTWQTNKLRRFETYTLQWRW